MSRFANLSPPARGYVVAVAILGASALIAATAALASSVDARWLVLVGLTVLTSSITVKIPSVAATISVSETFVFASVIVFGWPAGTLVAALDGFIISVWLHRRRPQPLYRGVFNVTAPALSAYLGAAVYGLLGAPSVSDPTFQITQILIPLCGFAATYFLANTSLLAVAIGLEQHASAIRIWRENFMWPGLNFFSGASMAALLVSFGVNNYENALGAVWVVLPLLGISYFTYKSSMARIEDANTHLDQMNKLYLSTIETLAMAIDAKDQITHGHIRRVQTFAVALANEVGITDQEQIKAIEAAALLHDMGKLAVPEYILNKPGALTPAEFDRMKLHAAVGADILSAIDFPYPVVPIVRHHHENWDGNGYPSGLKGSEIPVGARVLSVVDCFDALTSDRPYRPRLNDEEALQVVLDRRGSMYDPLIVDAFMRLYRRLKHDEAVQPSAASQSHLSLSQPGTSSPRLAAISASAGESRSMYRLIQRLGTRESYAAAISDVVEAVALLIPATAIAFYSPTAEGTELEVTHAAGSHAEWLKGRRVRFGERIVGWSASSGRSVLNADAQGEFGEVIRTIDPPIRSCLTAPLTNNSECLGVLTAFSAKEAGFESEDQRILEVIIRHVIPILERLKANGGKTASEATSHTLDLTPVGMIACRCASTTAAGTESVGIALGIIRRHLGHQAQTQVVHGNDVFVGIGLGEIESIKETAGALQATLSASGLLANGTTVVTAATPRDGTNLEHLLYACRQRLAGPVNPLSRVH